MFGIPPCSNKNIYYTIIRWIYQGNILFLARFEKHPQWHSRGQVYLQTALHPLGIRASFRDFTGPVSVKWTRRPLHRTISREACLLQEFLGRFFLLHETGGIILHENQLPFERNLFAFWVKAGNCYLTIWDMFSMSSYVIWDFQGPDHLTTKYASRKPNPASSYWCLNPRR